MRFNSRFRGLAGGEPAGFKLCVGSRVDVLAICKAMVEEQIAPDFVIVDGAEGGTGAAPLEYEDHVGMPLTEALMTVHNALVGVGLRDVAAAFEAFTSVYGHQSRASERSVSCSIGQVMQCPPPLLRVRARTLRW